MNHQTLSPKYLCQAYQLMLEECGIEPGEAYSFADDVWAQFAPFNGAGQHEPLQPATPGLSDESIAVRVRQLISISYPRQAREIAAELSCFECESDTFYRLSAILNPIKLVA